MQFFGAFALLVLPLFLIVCIKMVQQSSLHDRFLGKFLIAIFYLNIAFAISISLYIFRSL